MQMDQHYELDLINGQVLDEVFYPYHLSHIELDHKDILEIHLLGFLKGLCQFHPLKIQCDQKMN